MAKINTTELSDYLKALLEGINKGIENSGFIVFYGDKIEVELAIVNTIDAEGTLGISILKADGKYHSEEVSKIKIPFRPKSALFFNQK